MSTLQNALNSNATTPLSSTQGGLGVSAPTAHGVLVAEGSSAVTPIVLTDGQLLIGFTGADPSAATLTAGSGITITNASGSVTIANSAAGFTWNNVTGTTSALAAHNGYISNNASAVTYTLPSTAAIGDQFVIVGGTSGAAGGSWIVAQNAGQTIHFGNADTTAGTGGSLTSTNQYDAVTITCVAANTDFVVYASQGEITVA